MSAHAAAAAGRRAEGITMKITILTIFPEMFAPLLSYISIGNE